MKKYNVESDSDLTLYENTYAPMDLFDWLSIIQKLKGEGLTQKEIGEKIGWSRGKENQYEMLLNKIDTSILDLCKQYQNGRVSEKDTSVSFDFTEGWFRTSGLYDLNSLHQLGTIRWFFEKKIYKKKSNQLLYDKTSQLKEIEEQIEVVHNELNPTLDRFELLCSVEKGEYTTERLRHVIIKLNEGAKNQAYFGVDCRDGLKTIEDNSIDCIITDVPVAIIILIRYRMLHF